MSSAPRCSQALASRRCPAAAAARSRAGAGAGFLFFHCRIQRAYQVLQHTFHTLILPLRVEGGQGATEVITASIPLSSPLPDEFMAPQPYFLHSFLQILRRSERPAGCVLCEREAAKAVNPSFRPRITTAVC